MIYIALEHVLTHISFSIILIVISVHLIKLLVPEIMVLCNSLEKGIITTFFCITGLLITRWVYSKHLPLNNLYESLMFLSWGFSTIYIYSKIWNHQNNLNTIMTPSAVFCQAFATSGILSEMHQPAILVPALQSQWLMMHVSMMLLSYAALLCGSLLSVSFLVIIFRKNIEIWDKMNPFFFSFLIEPFLLSEVRPLKKKTFLQFKNYYKYQLTRRLDHWGYRIINLGFTLLTIGILSGAVWANEAWGSYWNWDPKETWAFITWTIFAIYLHMRTNQRLRGMNSAIVASIGFFIIWICYFGVNLLGIGLHSYGTFTSIFT
uniref:CcsA n=1 Tax=Peperomia cookiana TaxID=2510903 RepID=UPI0026E3681C|nr:CcsA [Peperomia cookiana]WJK72572.1 CcsA [Peperomia cookiana]